MGKNVVYRRGRSVVSTLHAHFVFVTKYRRGVISGRAFEVVRDSMKSVCRDFGVILKEIDGEDDHVHLLVEYPPTVALSRLVNSLKGVSSRKLRSRKFPEVTERLWGGHLWSPSYFVASCGGVTIETVRAYIENQRKPD
jgi:putative transposase